ncbi:N-6 DNA methylase, partial [Pseudomonas sp. FSL R10-0399]
CDSLRRSPPKDRFDLVIGNPPYGRAKLDAETRERYKRSLYGHANLYGLFTDLALRHTKPGGVIAYVTPTSFLAGVYFK